MSDKPKLRIAVTGSNGQLGQEFASLAGSHPELEFFFLSREVFPLDDLQTMESWILKQPVDYFINCAAYTAVDKAESETEKAFQINTAGPAHIAAILAKTGTPLIHISTDYVFDGYSSKPLDENAIPNPINRYGATKLEGEREVFRNHPLSQVIRTSWLYSVYGNNFVKTMLRLMRDRPAIRVVADQTGSPTYAQDLALAILKIIGSDKFIPGIYHYSNEGETTWFDFAQEIKTLSGSACDVMPIPAADYPTPAKRPVYSLMDKSKIKETYGLTVPEWKTSLAICVGLLKKQGV